jgi:hypothetical protein
MHGIPSVCVAFHLDGAWSVHCPGGEADGDDEGIVGWTSV